MSDIHVGDRPVMRYTLVDEDGAAVDLSGATGKYIAIKSPRGGKTLYPATFTSDGTDGVIEARFVQPGPAGVWKGWGYVTGVDSFSGYSEVDIYPVLDTP